MTKGETKIDLHIHTNISDGLFSPKEVIEEAAKKARKKLISFWLFILFF